MEYAKKIHQRNMDLLATVYKTQANIIQVFKLCHPSQLYSVDFENFENLVYASVKACDFTAVVFIWVFC